MKRRIFALACVTATMGLAACGGDDSTGTTTTDSTATATAEPSESTSGTPNTAEVVTAANAFLDTLSAEQRETATYAFDDPAKQAGWSNFPTTFAARAGVPFLDLDEAQRTAALAVMEAALSDQGYERLQGIREADAFLATVPDDGGAAGATGGAPDGGDDDDDGPPAGAGGDDDDAGGPGGTDVAGTQTTDSMFDRNSYFIAFFGEPSETGEFMLQYGGHHLGYNFTYAADTVSISPSHTAVEPPEFDAAGRTYTPLADEAEAAFGAIESLGTEELAEAEISGSFDDLLLGPGADGPYPEPEGVLVGDLTAEQKTAVEEMLRVWAGDIDESISEGLIAKYVSELDESYIGWSGSNKRTNPETYIRLDGPSAWIEFSIQSASTEPGYHFHTMFRDETADYGGS